MPEGAGGEKTEKASPKRRQDERKKGNVFTSRDIVSVAGILVSFYLVRMFLPPFLKSLQNNYLMQLVRAVEGQVLSPALVMTILREIILLVFSTLLPPLLVLIAVPVLAVGAQTRFLFSGELIRFKGERLNPMSGIKKMFTLRSLVELAKSLIKVCIIGFLVYSQLKRLTSQLPAAVDFEIPQAAAFAGREIMSIVVAVTIAFGAVAVLDYLYQRWEYEKGIMMSKQEMKMEYKQMEGDPQIKSRMREKQREFASRRMMQQVKDADVVVRNPTHYAVALKYRLGSDEAPIVLAKGQDIVALRIVQEAQKYNIATIENKPLARGLYELAELDECIPAEFYQAVAEVLAWLYNAREKEKSSR